MINIFNIFKQKKTITNSFYERLMNDWGKDDVYGPWTKENPNDKYIKYYKSYWLITTDETPDIDILKSDKLSDFNS